MNEERGTRGARKEREMKKRRVRAFATRWETETVMIRNEKAS